MTCLLSKKVNLIYFLIFEIIKLLCLFPCYKVKNRFKKCGKKYFKIEFLLFERDLSPQTKTFENQLCDNTKISMFEKHKTL